MNEEKQPTQIKLEVKIRDDLASGRYTNMAIAHHNDSEFILDFVFVQPQAPRAEVAARIIMSPRNLKRTVRLLEDRLAHYEKLFGEVSTPSAPAPESTYH